MAAPKKAEVPDQSAEVTSPRCGMIRPIADMDDYNAAHWREVHDIVAEPVNQAGYDLKLVSESDASSVILSEIVTNIYANDLVIADVSGRNANVMFELGMRMAFQKPVIIIMDDATPFSFDISPVKHLIYPKTLRFSLINEFKLSLRKMIDFTLSDEGKKTGTGYLKQFGRIEVSGLDTQHIDANQMAQDIADLKRYMGKIASGPEIKLGPAWSSFDNPDKKYVEWVKTASGNLKPVKRRSIQVSAQYKSRDAISEIVEDVFRINGIEIEQQGENVRMNFDLASNALISQAYKSVVIGRILSVDPSAKVVFSN